MSRTQLRSAVDAETAAGVLAALLLAAVTVPYSPSMIAGMVVPRLAFFFPMAALLVAGAAWSGRRPARAGGGGFTGGPDSVDAAAAALVVWIVVTALLSPAPYLAWVGAYNRGTGAFFWIACVAVFLAARRLLASPRARAWLVGAAAALLGLQLLTSLMQVSGLETFWGPGFASEGRMTGTMGNPVMLGGVSLLALWTGATAALAAGAPPSRGPVVVRTAAALGAAAGLAAAVLAVSRAAYLALGLGALLLVILLVRGRRPRSAAVVVAVAACLAVATVAYSPAGVGAGGALATRLATEGLDTQSDRGRIEFWQAGLEAVRERPLTGVGAGAYTVAYRRFQSPEQVRAEPDVVVSDPHSLPVLLAATTGLPGLALGVGLAALVGRSLLRGGANAAAALVYLVAASVFFLFNPADVGTIVPLALVAGAGVGPPRASGEGGRLVLARRRIRGGAGSAAGRTVSLVLLAGSAAAVVAAVVWAAGVWSADRDLGTYDRTGDVAAALRAAASPRWGATYPLVAGFAAWRAGAARGEEDLLLEGEAQLRRALVLDPFSVEARLELARLYLRQERPSATADEIRAALGVDAHHPIAQGLLGHLAYRRADIGAGEEAAALLDELEALPADTPDAWYWIGRTREALGDAVGAGLALDRAAALDPSLDPDEYVARVAGPER